MEYQVGNIIISLEKTFKLLEENANSKMNEYFFAVYELFEKTANENCLLRGENCILKESIETLKEILRVQR